MNRGFPYPRAAVEVITPPPVKWATREPFPWSDASIALLRKYAQEGFSASQIAALLGNGLTRCAVSGKAHRNNIKLGVGTPRDRTQHVLHKQAKPRAKRSTFSNTYKHSTEKTRKPPYVRCEPIAAPESKKLKFEQLSDHVCKWPGERDEKPPFVYCGHDPVPSLPYCEFHCLRAYPNMTPEHIARLRQMALERA